MSGEKNKSKEPDQLIEPTTIEHLIVLLVSSDTIILNKNYVFSFFLSSRAFIKSHELLIQLFEKNLCFILEQPNLTQKSLHKSIRRFVYIIREWACHFPYDFRELAMVNAVEYVQKRCFELDASIKTEFNEILAVLAVEIQKLERYEKKLAKLGNESNKKLNKQLTDTSIFDVCTDPAILAQQLTAIELDRLSHIGPEEFLEFFMNFDLPVYDKKALLMSNITDSDASGSIQDVVERKLCSKSFEQYLVELRRSCETDVFIKKNGFKPSKMRKSNNIHAYIAWFNRLSSIVCSEIVKNTAGGKERRVMVINFFIEVAFECYQRGNFNSTMAIVAALNSFQIYRLKKTWKKVNLAKWDILVKQTDSSNNYHAYRELLKHYNGQQNPNLVIIPIFTLVMKDLNFLYSSLPNSKGYLNLTKFWLMAKYITEYLDKQEQKIKYKMDSDICNYLLTETTLTEDSSAFLSFKCEPPINPNEIQYLEKLKMKIFYNS